jgi:pimeloyl-ACP methyl ester carboxylesterase
LEGRASVHAPDLRGYGTRADAPGIHPENGVGDWVSDLVAMHGERRMGEVDVVGHSLGGLIAMALVADGRVPVRSLTLYAPGPPQGYDSKPADPAFVAALLRKDRDVARGVIRALYVHPEFRYEHEDDLVDALLAMRVGPGGYPDTLREAISSRRNPSLADRFIRAKNKPPVTWVRGENDLLVTDFGPNAPDQAMITQTRLAFRLYALHGGSFEEILHPNCGHCPFLEIPAELNRFPIPDS